MSAEREETILKGILFANLLAIPSLWLTTFIASKLASTPTTIMFSTQFIIVPILMGMISGWVWQPLNFRTRHYIGYSIVNGLVAISLSFIFLKEGAICLLIVCPLIFAFITAGTFIARKLLKQKNNKLNLSVIGLLVILSIQDLFSEHQYENMVSDEIVINASPKQIWKNVVAFEKITTPNDFWLFNIGMPSPSETTVSGYYQGASRKCIFSNGYVFDEKMIVFKPEENLTFDITHQPRDPEIMGHIDILRGQFLLKDNGNGTTTLVGNSWYKLYVFPTWYYNLWAESITRNVHLRAMKHIKQLSEKK